MLFIILYYLYYCFLVCPQWKTAGTAVEFHECCLVTGSTVTLVGELLRSASGELTLQPLSQEQVSWRTSWETAGAEDLELLEAERAAFVAFNRLFHSIFIHFHSLPLSAEARTHVLISDDPTLLSAEPSDEPEG